MITYSCPDLILTLPVREADDYHIASSIVSEIYSKPYDYTTQFYMITSVPEK